MNRFFHPLLALTAVLGVASAGVHFLRAAGSGSAPEVAPAPRPAKPLIPVRVTDARAETTFAVKPKELSSAVKKGLVYLAKAQQTDGGWGQGGGWRTSGGGGGRIEGADVKDPSDIGNTALALLALVRAGNTTTEGEYKDAVKKGLAFILAGVEKADAESLSLTAVKDTQLQSKIGRFVDTFLANLVLSELRGKAGDQEKKLASALEKTMTKIVKHQALDGTFPGNEGWAPVLSVAIANKSVVRAKQSGVVVDDRVLARMFAQSQASASGDAVTLGPSPGGYGFGGGFGGGSFSGAGDAGVKLYKQGQGFGNLGDATSAMRFDAERSRQILKDAKASADDKKKAEKQLEELKKAEEVNAKAQAEAVKNVKDEAFVAGFGSNGGEEFLSFLNISEALLLQGGKAWEEWDAKMVKGLEKAQDKDGSWQGHHCITGKTFCTASALLVLMADRTPFPREVLIKAK